jgi:hypothetical protein
MFVMTLYKCVLTMYPMDRRVMPVWRLFLRDGVVWFVLVFGMYFSPPSPHPLIDGILRPQPQVVPNS